MIITTDTVTHEVAIKTKTVMNREVLPNMILKSAVIPNGFISEVKDYEFWLNQICGRSSNLT